MDGHWFLWAIEWSLIETEKLGGAPMSPQSIDFQYFCQLLKLASSLNFEPPQRGNKWLVMSSKWVPVPGTLSTF